MSIDPDQGATPGTGPRRRDARVNHARVVAAAAQLFAAEGLAATQADIARQAGLGVGTLYRRFPTKDELIWEVYAPRLRGTEDLAAEASRAPRAWDGLVLFLQRSAAELAADRGFRQFILGGFVEDLGWSRTAPTGALVALLEETDRRVSTMMGQVIRRAQDDGDLRGDVTVTDLQMITAAVQAVMQLGGEEHPQLYQRMLSLVLDGLRATSATLPVRALTPAELGRLTHRTRDLGPRSPR